jgi:hypothetical protein
MNLLRAARLGDSCSVTRYLIGVQVKECSDMASLKRLANKAEHAQSTPGDAAETEEDSLLKDKFQELSDMFNL